jgi:hypothetical protein
MLYFVDQDCDGACHLKNYSFVITYLLEDEQELSLEMLDTSQIVLMHPRVMEKLLALLMCVLNR